MKTCPYCGNLIPDDSTFCECCGRRFEKRQQDATPVRNESQSTDDHYGKFNTSRHSSRHSSSVIIAIGALIFICFVAYALLSNVLDERRKTAESAELASLWSNYLSNSKVIEELPSISFSSQSQQKSKELISECDYRYATDLLDGDSYAEAKEVFMTIPEYKDSIEMAYECDYRYATKLLESDSYDDAKQVFATISEYKNSTELANESDYEKAESLFAKKKYSDAQKIYESIQNYKDSNDKVLECAYQNLMSEFGGRKLWQDSRANIFFSGLEKLGTYKDCDKLLLKTKYDCATNLYNEGSYIEAAVWFSEIKDYEDSSSMYEKCYVEAVNSCVERGEYENAIVYCNTMKDKGMQDADAEYNYVCETAYDVASTAQKKKEWETAKTVFLFLSGLDYSDSKDRYDKVVKLEEEAKKKAEEKRKAEEKAKAQKEAEKKAAQAAEKAIYDNITGTWACGSRLLKIKNKKWNYYVDEQHWIDFKWAGLNDPLTYRDGVYYLTCKFWEKTYSATISGNTLTLSLYSDDNPNRPEMKYTGTYEKISSSID